MKIPAIKLLSDRILVTPIVEETTRKSGIIILKKDSSRDDFTTFLAQILILGEDAEENLSVGDIVHIRSGEGWRLEIGDGENYLVVREPAILAMGEKTSIDYGEIRAIVEELAEWGKKQPIENLPEESLVLRAIKVLNPDK